LPRRSDNESPHDIELYVKLNSLGELYIHCEERIIATTTDELDRILAAKVNPLLKTLNGFLSKNGYTIPLFSSIQSRDIGIKHFHEQWTVSFRKPIEPFSMLQSLPCIRTIFDVYDDVDADAASATTNTTKQQIVLRYKRMYSDAEGQGQLIRELKRMEKSSRDIVEALMINYRMPMEQAKVRLERFVKEEEERVLIRSSNKEYFFPIQMEFQNNKLVVDIYKFCRDCGVGDAAAAAQQVNGLDEYKVGPKLRIRRRKRPSMSSMVAAATLAAQHVPTYSWISLLESYTHSIMEIVLGLHKVPLPDVCEKMVFGEVPGTDQETEDVIVDTTLAQEIVLDTPEDVIEDIAEERADVVDQEADEDQEEEEEEEEDEEEGSDDEDGDDDGFLFGGAKKFRSKLDYLKEADPKLFFASKKGVTEESYGRICQRDHQPVVMNQDVYEATLESHPDLQTIHYQTAPHKKHWYACPKYWCAANNQILSEKEVEEGVCKDNVVTSNYTNPSFEDSTKHPHPDGYCLPCCFKGDVTKKPLHKDRIQKCQASGNEDFTKVDTAAADSKPVATTAMAAPTVDPVTTKPSERSILKYSSVPPVSFGRWCLLPKQLQYLLNVDYTKITTSVTNTTKILPNHPCFLLYGIEHPKQQSFLGLFAEIYSYKKQLPQTVSVAEMRNILVTSVTLDQFLQSHNGSFPSVFGTKDPSKDRIGDKQAFDQYANTKIYQTIDWDDSNQVAFFQKLVTAFENFLAFIGDTNTPIDHAYLWDILSSDVLLPGGCNLVILELNHQDKDSIDFVCPPSEMSFYDPRKESFLVLKTDAYYEPIYQYLDQDGKTLVVTKGFYVDKLKPTSTLRKLLELLESSTHRYCLPVKNPGMPKTASQIQASLHTFGYTIHYQVWNSHGKIVGFYVSKYAQDQKYQTKYGIFVPCSPSGIFVDSPYKNLYVNAAGMVSEEVESNSTIPLWKSYTATVKRLRAIVEDTNHEITCEPKRKVVDPATGKVIGILTETTQYIPVNPHETVATDDLETIIQTDHMRADQILALEAQGDTKRRTAIQMVALETQFYLVFRSVMRRILNEYSYRTEKKTILEHMKQYEAEISQDGVDGIYQASYTSHLMEIAVLLRNISKDAVVFEDYDDDEIHAISPTMISSECEGESKLWCSGKRLKLPKWHLVYDDVTRKTQHHRRDVSNKNIYYMRLADELLRYPRIQFFMFQPQTFLNITAGMSEYRLLPTEILVLESFLTDEYFRDMIPFNTSEYIHQTNYDTASPANMVGDPIPPLITLEEQSQMTREIPKDIQARFTESSKCILVKNKKDNFVEGNELSLWKQTFPKQTREVFFQGAPPTCTFAVIQNLLVMAGVKVGESNTVLDIKQTLWEGYKRLVSDDESILYKILDILRTQGKKTLLKSTDLETAIMSEDYFVTNLDLWVLASSLNIPLILFSVKSIDMTGVPHWMYLTTQYTREFGGAMTEDVSSIYRPIHFIRAPLSVKKGEGPSYSLIESAFLMDHLRKMTDDIMDAVRNRTMHVISLERFLREKVAVITKLPRRGKM
jgi:hypothetical protein